MASRSRKGCIDCKQAKVKCDEVHPSCGTCARRGRQCRGYHSLDVSSTKSPAHRRKDSITQRGDRVTAVTTSDIVGADSTTLTSTSQSEQKWSAVDEPPKSAQKDLSAPSPQFHSRQDPYIHPSTFGEAESLSALIADAAANPLRLLREPRQFPADELLPADKTLVEIYFVRHPTDLAMSNEFVNEMNAAVISLLHESPAAVIETLSAIGENYMTDANNVMAPALCRKTRLLKRLRLVNEDGSSLELILGILLGLCGAELVQTQTDERGVPIMKLVDNISLMLQYHLKPGEELSKTARYFVRALARQDLLISLARMRRTKINPSLWLDEDSMSRADRLWGYTTTLAPLLIELCAFAEDVQSIMDAYSHVDRMEVCAESDLLASRSVDLAEREASIRSRLVAWRPEHDFSITMQTARKVLLHAYAWRAAALLYLYRLLNRAGSSIEADQIALGMAYDVMVHLPGPGETIKMSLWPLFLAACEMDKQEDRDYANELFDGICQARPTVTGQHTKWFCVNQVWPARDRGRDWDWMQLSRAGSNDFIPI